MGHFLLAVARVSAEFGPLIHLESAAGLTQGAALSTVGTAKLSVQAAANYSHSSSSSELHRRTLGPHRLSTTSGKEFTDLET